MKLAMSSVCAAVSIIPYGVSSVVQNLYDTIARRNFIRIQNIFNIIVGKLQNLQHISNVFHFQQTVGLDRVINTA